MRLIPLAMAAPLRAIRSEFATIIAVLSAAGGAAGFLFAAHFLGLTGFAAIPFERMFSWLAVAVVSMLLVVATVRTFPTPRFRSSVFLHAVLFLAAIAFISTLVGVWRGNEFPYVVTDPAALLLVTFMYCVGLLGTKVIDASGDSWRRLVAVVAVVVVAFDLLGLRVDQALVVVLLTHFCIALVRRRIGYAEIACLVPLAILFSNLNRALILALLVGLITVWLVVRVRERFRLSGRALLLAAVLGLTMVISQGSQGVFRQIAVLYDDIRVVVATGFSPDAEISVPISQRLYEARLVMDSLVLGESVLVPVLGHGAGATLDMTGSNDASVKRNALLGAEAVHNIHLLPFLFLYRYGYLGLFAFGLVCLGIVRMLWRLRRTRNSQPVSDQPGFALTLYILLATVATLPAGGDWFANPLMFFLMGVIDHQNNIRSAGERDLDEGLSSRRDDD